MFSLHDVFLKKFPFTYGNVNSIYMLVLHLPIGHLMFILQDLKVIKAKHFAVSKTQLIILLLLFFTKYWHAGSLL